MKFYPECLIDDGDYKRICETFLSMVQDKEMRKSLKSLLYSGKCNDYRLKSKFDCIDYLRIEIRRRVAMASVFIRNPDVFSFFERNNINVFHGTNANALPTILKYGLNSEAVLAEKGIPILTGEEWSRGGGKRQFISFTDVLDVAEHYSGLPSDKGSQKMNFGVIIGVSESEFSKANIVDVYSNTPEIGVAEHFPLESISCICVPNDKVNFVSRIIGNTNITVLGMSDIENRPFRIDKTDNIEFLWEDYANIIADGVRFTASEIEEMVRSRSISRIRYLAEKIKDFFEKGAEEDVRRGTRK